jgi:hypothetical protein
MNHSVKRPRALAAILWGGAIAGAFDLTYATIFYSFRGVKPIRVSQSIASGLPDRKRMTAASQRRS